MATVHQLHPRVRFDHDILWTVVIDPPHQPRALYSTTSRDLAEVYLRGLWFNNPLAAQYAYILPPAQNVA